MFTSTDLKQIAAHGVSMSDVERQMNNFKCGFDFLKIDAPASAGDGVEILDKNAQNRLTSLYDGVARSKKIVKFVPASGAATRMFKDLFEFVDTGRRTTVVDQLLAHKESIAFWPLLSPLLPQGASDEMIVRSIIMQPLGYGAKPKAMIPFHRYGESIRCAIEEHLVEGAAYAGCADGVNIHFTLSDEHIPMVEELLERVTGGYSRSYGVEYHLSHSIQKNSTDTIAVNPDNTPFRTADGRLLFRPAGHGALVENLGEIDADIIFVKNIDNVTTDALRGDTVHWKRVLAGLLVERQRAAFEMIRQLESGCGNELLPRVREFIEHDMHVKLPAGFELLPAERQIEFIMVKLRRPIRVCGVVRNEGEPGGGPFWVHNADGTRSLQIAESSQIDPRQKDLMASATYFNPVDLVCGVRRPDGGRYDLRRFVDPSTGFISAKSKEGRELKAQELPGLWNGAMADWNTIFVEVPVSTFSPVKVVTDLLRRQHQG